MNRLIPLLLGVSLMLSLALTIFLWSRLSQQSRELHAAQSRNSEMDELQRQNQELQRRQKSLADSASANVLELARLRNEVGQLRKQVRESAAAAAQGREKLAAAAQDLARAERELAEALDRSPEEWQRMIQEEKSRECVSKLKEIGLAARMWASDHNDVFPPDLISMTNELSAPEVLFCPADTAVVRVFEWSQLNPSSVSYRFLNATGTQSNPSNVLTICPIHGHVGLSDGSVRRR